MSQKIEVKLKCSTVHDEVEKVFRRSCEMCSIRPGQLEPGVKYVEVEEQEGGEVQVPTFLCPHTQQELKIISAKQVSNTPTIIGFKMNKAEIAQDRLKRSRTDFQKNILPGLSTEDKKLFTKPKQ